MEEAWHFNELIPGLKIREATQDEFFSADVIRGAAEALVREGIQNSLDAAEKGNRVRVTIFLGTLSSKDELSSLEHFLDNGWEHFEAPDNGLANPPDPGEPCRYLVFEDFGTSGLTGDPRQLLPVSNVENRFFHFFRVEGRSDKHEDDRGRWGIGKQVFPRASRIKSVYGLTLRSDDLNHFLMGQTILRSHEIEGTYFQDGWFGHRLNGERAVYPTDDSETIAAFTDLFDLSRGDEPGLSLVVPYLQDDITEQDVLAAVLRGYFYPILMGDLDVEVRGESFKHELNSETISTTVDQLPAELRAEIRPALNLAIWSKNNKDPLPELQSPDPQGSPRWSEDIIPQEVREFVRDNLRNQRPFGIRVPLSVRPRDRGKPQRPSYFDVLLVRDDKDTSGRPIFIREGIIVSDVRGHRSRGVRSLVVVGHGALATMLGDSENPAHTQWQRDGSKFKDRYYFGSAYIRFVADSVAEIVRLSTEAEDQEDIALLADIFSLPADDGEDGIEDDEESEKQDEEKKIEKPKIPKGLALLRFDVSAVEGGFTVTPVGSLAPLPATVRIRAAYDVRRGNAFNKYNSADFRLDKMSKDLSGAEVSTCHENQMVLRVSDEKFSLTVKGFDPKRDVRVSVTRLVDPQ